MQRLRFFMFGLENEVISLLLLHYLSLKQYYQHNLFLSSFAWFWILFSGFALVDICGIHILFDNWISYNSRNFPWQASLLLCSSLLLDRCRKMIGLHNTFLLSSKLIYLSQNSWTLQPPIWQHNNLAGSCWGEPPFCHIIFERCELQIDGFEQEKRVVVVAATNRKQDLDPALIR